MDLARALKTAAVSSTTASSSSENVWNLDYVEPDNNSALNWDISNRQLRYQKTISGDTASIRSLFLKPDGTKLYTTGETSDKIFQYTLDPAWSFNDIGTPDSYYQLSGTNQLNPFGLHFKPDGTKMYVIVRQNDYVNEYDLSTAWDVTTASLNNQFTVGAQETSVESVFFKTDGTKMYITGLAGDDVNEYNLSTAWDVSTASYSQKTSVSAQDTSPTGLYFKSDGTSMWMVGNQGDDINEYSMSTAWDISTLSYVQNVGLGGTVAPMGIFFKPDGSRVYIAKTASPDAIREYYISIKRFSVGGQETVPEGVFFKTDGTKMYVIGRTGDDINEYDLSTAWEVDTATFNQNQSVSAQENNPRSLYFKPDGTKLYVIGSSGDDVNEYNLSTAWDISTMSYVQNVSILGATPEGLTFKSDGTKMYVTGSYNDTVYEYDLSTAWDVSTASLNQSLDVSSKNGFPTAIQFKDDGTKMFLSQRSSTFDGLHEYALSTAWDISSATYTTYFRASENNPTGFFFKPDGTRLYIIGIDEDTVFQFTVG